MLRNQKGFTLIELIIVIVIIGILAAVAIPKFNTLDESAKIAACDKNVMNIQQAAISYYGDTAIANNGQGTWPADVDALIGADLLQSGTYTCPVDNASSYSIGQSDGVVTCGGSHA